MPLASATVVAVLAPLRTTVAPLPPVVGLSVPEMLHVAPTACAVKFTLAWLLPLIVTARLAGVNVYPDLDGVTV